MVRRSIQKLDTKSADHLEDPLIGEEESKRDRLAIIWAEDSSSRPLIPKLNPLPLRQHTYTYFSTFAQLIIIIFLKLCASLTMNIY